MSFSCCLNLFAPAASPARASVGRGRSAPAAPGKISLPIPAGLSEGRGDHRTADSAARPGGHADAGTAWGVQFYDLRSEVVIDEEHRAGVAVTRPSWSHHRAAGGRRRGRVRAPVEPIHIGRRLRKVFLNDRPPGQTGAFRWLNLGRRGSESNRRPRLCRPLHNHSATPPNCPWKNARQ